MASEFDGRGHGVDKASAFSRGRNRDSTRVRDSGFWFRADSGVAGTGGAIESRSICKERATVILIPGESGPLTTVLNKMAEGSDSPAMVRFVIGRIDAMMMLKGVLTGATAAGMMLAISAFALAQTRQPGSVSSGYAPVNGLKLYYEIHGTGEPLILLHGGLGSTEMFTEILPVLSQGHRAIAVDLQAHGRTGDIDRPMSFDAMADDIAALMKHLVLEKADVMGYSIGGA